MKYIILVAGGKTQFIRTNVPQTFEWLKVSYQCRFVTEEQWNKEYSEFHHRA